MHFLLFLSGARRVAGLVFTVLHSFLSLATCRRSVLFLLLGLLDSTVDTRAPTVTRVSVNGFLDSQLYSSSCRLRSPRYHFDLGTIAPITRHFQHYQATTLRSFSLNAGSCWYLSSRNAIRLWQFPLILVPGLISDGWPSAILLVWYHLFSFHSHHDCPDAPSQARGALLRYSQQ